MPMASLVRPSHSTELTIKSLAGKVHLVDENQNEQRIRITFKCLSRKAESSLQWTVRINSEIHMSNGSQMIWLYRTKVECSDSGKKRTRMVYSVSICIDFA